MTTCAARIKKGEPLYILATVMYKTAHLTLPVHVVVVVVVPDSLGREQSCRLVVCGLPLPSSVFRLPTSPGECLDRSDQKKKEHCNTKI